VDLEEEEAVVEEEENITILLYWRDCK